MKSLLIAVTLFLSSPDKEVITYRELLHKSFYSQAVAEQYYTKMKGITTKSAPVLQGYKAMSEFLMCKHAFNPFSKLIHFNRGKKELDAAIEADPNNVELLFLRFATQCNAPSFLGYNTHITSDKIQLLNYIYSEKSSTDKDLREKIAKFMLKSKHTSSAEKKHIKL